MRFSACSLSAAVCAATLILNQTQLPTVKAQSLSTSAYCVQVQSISARRSYGGLILTGRVLNVGSKPLAYTKVVPVLEDQNGKTVYTGNGYLTVSPLQPGQAAEFRACEQTAPAFSQWHVEFREAGNMVLVSELYSLIRQAATSRRASITR